MKVYLISTNYLKDNSTINLNVEDSLIKNAILEGQRINIQQMLGTSLYDKIIELVGDDSIDDSINVNYKSLLTTYIQPCLTYWAQYHSIPFLNYKINNKNIGQQSSENTEPAELDEVKYLTSLVKDKAEFYTELGTKYLKKNTTLFPEFTTSDNCGLIHPNKTNYSSGMCLD